TVEPTFAAFGGSSHGTDWAWSDAQGMRSGPWSDRLLDEVVLDAFWWQLLGPGHLRRLGGPPPGARPLAAGRVELAVGDPADWLFAQPPEGPWHNFAKWRRDPWVYARARDLLQPCLLTSNQAARLDQARNTGEPPP
ncbi:MAG TPA: hypothetical protein VM324_09625, partial [Egibacteraceae bacterium]|nr:hypothetical protein [Egibacteraceae bacterium]